MFYEWATMTLPMGTAADAAQRVESFCRQRQQGQLLACWFTEIGVLNQMIVLRRFDSVDAIYTERTQLHSHASPYGCGDLYQDLSLESFRGFPWMAPASGSEQSGIVGPVYEIRNYGIKPGGVEPTLSLWEQYLPARHRLSPCVLAMLALDGPPRFINIWAYGSLNARSQARADAVAQGIWPPKGGPAHLSTRMQSTIVLPTAVSPMK